MFVLLMCAHADMHAERWLPLLLLYCVPGRLASGLSSGLGAGGNRRGEGRVAASARGPASGAPLWPGSVFMSVFKSTAPWGREREREREDIVIFPCALSQCPVSGSVTECVNTKLLFTSLFTWFSLSMQNVLSVDVSIRHYDLVSFYLTLTYILLC